MLNQDDKLFIMISALTYKKLFPKVFVFRDVSPKLDQFII